MAAPAAGVAAAGASGAGTDAAPAKRETAGGVPCSFFTSSKGESRRNLHPRELAEVLKAGDGFLWVDIDTTSRSQTALLEKLFHFHPLAIEDALNPESRAKVEEYSDFLFLVLRGVRFCDTTDDPYDLETFNLSFFLRKNVLVTAHGEQSPAIAETSHTLDRAPELITRGVEWVMHHVADAVTDAFFPIVDQIDAFIDGLEERVFVNFDQAALRDIFSVKRLVLNLRRNLVPQREVFNVLTNRPTPLLRPETQVYFRDVYDHVLRINDSLDGSRDLLSSTMDSYLTQVSNRLSQTTKTLSVVATVTLPFVVMSGMWGMNVDYIPLQHHAYAFWIVVGLQLLVGIGLLAYLKIRKLL